MDMKKRWKLAGLGLLALGLLYLYKQHHITMEEILSWQPKNLFLAAFSGLCSVYKAKDLFLDYLYRSRKEGRRGEGRDSHILVLNKWRPFIHSLSSSPERLQSRMELSGLERKLVS